MCTYLDELNYEKITMKKEKYHKTVQYSIAIALSLFISAPSLAQEDLFELSLEELMNISIVSASKEKENLFDAPVSSYSISQEEILQAGITSIPEAMRLVPGVIVREITNGHYDIHLRGFDNVTRYGTKSFHLNTLTLLMINNRVVTSNSGGAIFWNALPIDINDVQNIEVVRGPAAALYGPNAVSGVINILTHKPMDEGVFANGSVQAGGVTPLIANAYVGIKPGDKFDVAISANYQKRNRHVTEYYNSITDEFVAEPTDLVWPAPGFPDPSANEKHATPGESMDKYGVNAFMNYQVNNEITFGLEAGLQRSEGQHVYPAEFYTQLADGFEESKYVNLTSSLYGARIAVSHQGGTRNIGVGHPDFTAYDEQMTTFNLEYDWKLTDQLSLRPGISYQSSIFDDNPYAKDKGLSGVYNGRFNLNTLSGSLRADYRPSDQWRVVGALRADQFSTPDDVYLAYQLATTYKINENHLIRGVVSKSNNSSFGGYAFADAALDAGGGVVLEILGSDLNDQFELCTVQMFELGYRFKLSNKLQFDIDLFTQEGKNFIMLAVSPPVGNVITALIQQSAMTARQSGITASVNFVPDPKWQFKPFITFQQTNVKDFPSEYADLTSTPVEAFSGDLSNTSDEEHKSTPAVYGGFYANYKPIDKLNINVSSYYYSQHKQYDSFDQARPSTIGDMSGKFLLNVKVSYELVSGMKVFVNARNITDDDSREYYGTDRTGSSYLGGISFDF